MLLGPGFLQQGKVKCRGLSQLHMQLGGSKPGKEQRSTWLYCLYHHFCSLYEHMQPLIGSSIAGSGQLHSCLMQLHCLKAVANGCVHHNILPTTFAHVRYTGLQGS